MSQKDCQIKGLNKLRKSHLIPRNLASEFEEKFDASFLFFSSRRDLGTYSRSKNVQADGVGSGTEDSCRRDTVRQPFCERQSRGAHLCQSSALKAFPFSRDIPRFVSKGRILPVAINEQKIRLRITEPCEKVTTNAATSLFVHGIIRHIDRWICQKSIGICSHCVLESQR